MAPFVPLRSACPLLSGALALVVTATGLTVVAGRPVAAATAQLSSVRLVAGAGLHDSAGNAWRGDRMYARGGRVVRVVKPVATKNARLFRTVRTGSFTYRIPVRPGVYTVRVNTVAVSRAAAPFSVRANGVIALRRVDPLREAGIRRAYSRTAIITVRGNRLTLAIAGKRGGAVSSISVLGRRGLPAPAAAAPTPTPAPVTSAATAPAASVSPETFGAKGDGVTDDAAALQRTFAGAAGRTVLLGAGKTYAFGSVLQVKVAGLRITGAATLLALNEQYSSVLLDADDVTLDGGVTVRTKKTTTRWGTFDQMGVRLGARAGITLRDITVDGSAAAGIYVGGSDHFTLDRVRVQNTRADGIHMTQGASFGTVTSPTVINSADDGVAVVSYKSDGAPCHDISVTSPRVLGTTWGRGLSVVGGRNITETDVYVTDTSAAGIYIGAEGDPWYTAAPVNVTIIGGTILRANQTTSVEHGAVLVLSAANDVVPDAVTIKGLTIRDTAFKWRTLGVITYGATPRNILFQDITITGSQSGYGGNTAQSAYRLRNITKDGVRLPDQG